MKLLPDTCAVLWLADEPEKLGAAAMSSIQAFPDELYVSAISAFEIGIKNRKGRLALGMSPEDWWTKVVSDKNLQVHSVIIATAEGIQASTVTSDQWIGRYPSAMVVW